MISGKAVSFFVFSAVIALSSIIAWLFLPNFAKISSFEIEPRAVHIRKISQTSAAYEVRFEGSTGGAYLLYLPTHGGVAAVSLNGSSLGQAALRSDGRLSRHRHTSTLTIPSERIFLGSNTMRIDQTRNVAGIPISPIYLGPAEEIDPVVTRHLAVAPMLYQLIPLAAAFTAGLATLLIFFSRSPLKYAFLISAIICQLGAEFSASFEKFLPWLGTSSFIFGSLVMLLLFLTTAEWIKADKKYYKIAGFLMIGFLAASSLIGFIISGGPDIVYAIARQLFVIYNAVMIILLSYVMWADRNERGKYYYASIGILLAAIIVRSAHLASILLGDEVNTLFFLHYLVNIGLAMAVLLFITGALAVEVGEYRLERVKLSGMSKILAGHHFALDKQATQLKTEIEKRAVMEERERFTQDLHDGISGQLLSLLLQARRGALDPQEVEREVSQSLADLRLVTASIDTAEDSFAASLRSFRERAAQQLAIADKAFDWREDEAVEGVRLQARITLDVLRIMQEAITNIIRHSKANRVVITIGCAPPDTVVIEITDDGCGLGNSARESGNGIRNMRRRAARTGANVEWGLGLDGSGTVVTLTIALGTAISRSS